MIKLEDLRVAEIDRRGGGNSYRLTPEEKAEVDRLNASNGKQGLVDERNGLADSHGGRFE